jgi:hypothetical protein
MHGRKGEVHGSDWDAVTLEADWQTRGSIRAK